MIKKGYQYIVSVSGDGTINEVVNGFFVEENGYADSAYSSGTESSGMIHPNKYLKDPILNRVIETMIPNLPRQSGKR